MYTTQTQSKENTGEDAEPQTRPFFSLSHIRMLCYHFRSCYNDVLTHRQVLTQRTKMKLRMADHLRKLLHKKSEQMINER